MFSLNESAVQSLSSLSDEPSFLLLPAHPVHHPDDADSSQQRRLFDMAQASVEYLTTEAYIEHRWAQDDLIRKEFEKHHNQLETRHRELREDLDNVKADIRELKVDFGELKVDFQRMQGQMYNRSIRNLFVRIEPIGTYQHGTGLVMPERFPKNAHEFWNLRAPRSASHLKLLTYLVRFYDVQGYQTWKYTNARTNSQKSESEDGHDSNSESGSDIENSSLSLEEAVRTYPDMAVEALAPIIGLVEADFDSFRARAAEYRQKHQSPAIKRQPQPIDRTATKREEKRPKRTPISMPDPYPSIPLHQLIASPKSKSSDPASEQTRLEWDNTSALQAIQKILDRAKKGKSRTTQSPEAQVDGETVSAVQSVLDQFPRRRLRGMRETSSEVFPGSPTEAFESGPELEKSPGVEAKG